MIVVQAYTMFLTHKADFSMDFSMELGIANQTRAVDLNREEEPFI